MDLRDLPQEVLLVDSVATLVELSELALYKAPHLEDAQHVLSLVHQCEVVGQQLDLEGVGELLDHLEVKEVKEL
jgi:hypothetical protein